MCDETNNSVDPADEADIAPVVAFWKRLGLPGLIDVHTHFMPKRVMDKVWAYFEAGGPLIARPWPIGYRHDEHLRLDRLRRYGVRAYSSLVYPHKPDMAAWLNAWARDFAARNTDCLHTATLFPEPGVGEYVRTAIDSGAQLFKAHVQVGGYDPTDPLLTPAWAAIADAEVPVIIHCGSGPTPTPFTGPDPIARLLQQHPRLQLIVAHLGMDEYSQFLDLADRFPTLRFDTAGVFVDFTEERHPYPHTELPRLADLADRILFGSDFPNLAYRYIDGLDALAALDLGDNWLRAVCHHNAARLFRLHHPTGTRTHAQAIPITL
ncbi:amidohydrolase family protein [Nocardia sp. NPDC049149]|uniref:amidohydrolase family protein n=1 Tax=Nocardia sp. NPDC049149 TaxID=3364315 RepID=UPI0037166C4C